MIPEHDMLFGLLAWRGGLINLETLEETLTTHAKALDREPSSTLSDALVARGVIDEEDRRAVQALVDRSLDRHGGNLRPSLLATSADDLVRRWVDAPPSTDGPVTLSHGPVTLSHSAVGADPDPTASFRPSDDKIPETDPDLTASYRPSDGKIPETDPDSTRSLPAGRFSDDRLGTRTDDDRSGHNARYRLLRPHARGGLGVVFLAMDTELNREVALKQILDRHAHDRASRRRFLAEAEITGGLEHPGIVPVYGLGVHRDGQPYYAMRFIRGESLREAILRFHRDHPPRSDPGLRSLELRKLLRRFVDVCNAIDYAHSRGVLHRDIKPGNIIVGRHGETLVVDWGLAKVTGQSNASEPIPGMELPLAPSNSDSGETLQGQALGTPMFMSPEQAAGDLDRLGPTTDVYSLGATLHCLLTGAFPFEATGLELLQAVRKGNLIPPRRIDPAIDRSLEAICLKAMALDPADRYPAARALADDLERWMADEPVSARRDPWVVRLARWARRHRTFVIAAAVLLASTSILLAVSNALVRAEQRRTDEQRQLAEERREQAEDARAQAEDARAQAERSFLLARAMADDLGQVVTLNETGRAADPASFPKRKELLDQALQSARLLLEERPDDVDRRRQVADLFRFSANLSRLLGDRDAAGEAYRESLRLRETLDDTPADRSSGLETLRDLAVTLFLGGKLTEADATMTEVIAEAEALAEDDPPQFGRDLAVALLDHSEILQHLGRPDDAAQAAERADLLFGNFLERVQPRPPSVTPILYAMGASRLALIRRDQAGEHPDPEAIARVLDAHHEAVRRFRSLLEVDRRDDVVHNASLALTHRAATALDASTRLDQAAQDLDEAIDAFDGLAARHPTAPIYREALAGALVLRTRLRADDPEQVEAGRADLDRVTPLIEALVRSDPEAPAYRALLGEAWEAGARLAPDRERRELCIDRALSSFRAARNREPDNPKHSRTLARIERDWPEESAASAERRQASGGPQ